MDLEKNKRCFRISILILLVIIGFFLRYVSILETHVKNILSRDSKEYVSYAYNLRHHHIYSKATTWIRDNHQSISPDATRNPGYPLFLSIFIDGKPNSKMINTILFVHLIISTLTIPVFFFIFRKYLPLSLSTIATMMVVISPHLIAANSYLLTETLFCFMLGIIVIEIGQFIFRPSALLAFIMGVSLALANLVRPSLILFPIAMIIFLFCHYGKRRGVIYFLVLTAGFMIITSPWIIRNIKTIGKVSDSRLMINFLHHGLYPDFTYDEMPESYGFPYRYDPQSDEIGRNLTTVLNAIKNKFEEKPKAHMKWYLLNKPVAFWAWNNVQGTDIFIYNVTGSPYYSKGAFKISYSLMRSLHWWIVVIGALGAVLAWLPINPLILLPQQMLVARFFSLLLIYYTGIHMIGFPAPRYSIPIRPFMYGMALFSVYFIFNSTKQFVSEKGRKTGS